MPRIAWLILALLWVGCPSSEPHDDDTGDDDTGDDDTGDDDTGDDDTGDDDSGDDDSVVEYFTYEHLLGTGDTLLDGIDELFVNCCDVGTVDGLGRIHHLCSVRNPPYGLEYDTNSDGGLYHPGGSYVAGSTFRSFRREDGLPGDVPDMVLMDTLLTFGQPAVSEVTANAFVAIPWALSIAPTKQAGLGLFLYEYGSGGYTLTNLLDTEGAEVFHTPLGAVVEVQWVELDGIHVSVEHDGFHDVCTFLGTYSEPPSAVLHTAVFTVDETGYVIRRFGADDGIEVPGSPGTVLESISRPWLGGGGVFFVGTWGGTEGLLRYDLSSRSLALIADTTGSFDSFQLAPVVLGFSTVVANASGGVAFVAEHDGIGEGVFIATEADGYTPQLVVSAGTIQAENRTVDASRFFSLALSESGQLAFVARDSVTDKGLVYYEDGKLYLVFFTGDTFLSPPGASAQGGLVFANQGLAHTNPVDGQAVLVFRHLYSKSTLYDDIVVVPHSMMVAAKPTF